MKPQGFIPASASPSTHEGADLNVKLVVRTGTVLATTLVVLIGLLVLFFRHLEHVYSHRTSEAAPIVTAADLPPAPRLQTNPWDDLHGVQAREDRHLTRYAWVDRAQGVAQIPIERAMVLWANATTNPPTAAANAAPTELQMRQDKGQEATRAQ